MSTESRIAGRLVNRRLGVSFVNLVGVGLKRICPGMSMIRPNLGIPVVFS